MRAARLAASAACALLLAGCPGTELRGRAGALTTVIDDARWRGAERCAPYELAMAESHHEFAGIELDEGDYYRAEAELDLAERNARAAVALSPPDRCRRAVAGAGDRDKDGVPDARDQCPTRPEDRDGFEDQDGCPDLDNDNDGIPDKIDACPDKAEDKDGYQDDDGCPDEDNDGDGLADKIDQCPDQAEDKDGHEDDDGCPDCDDDGDGVPECPEAVDKCPGQAGRAPDGCPYQNVVVTDTRIEIKQTIYFDTGKATIQRVSYELLDEVARALQDHPKLRIRVEGHTDSQGKDSFNLKLSKARAAAVRQYLMGAGVAGDRLISDGYGETRPISDNRTAVGRSQNRRVEFVIIDR